MNVENKFLRIAKTVLTIWGAISLLGLITIVCYVYYSFGPGNKTVDDKASNSDVRFVLNWCGLGDFRIEKVLHSHVSARSFSGDHLDVYSIKINDVRIDELTVSEDSVNSKWFRGDKLPKLLSEALTFTGGWHHETPWFPKESEIRTSDFYIFPWSIYCHGVSPTGAQLIIVKPTDRIVYYISAKS